LPIDRWIPADRYIEPLIGDQIAAGYFRNFKDNTYEASVEVYYKWSQNLIDFAPQAEILLNNNLETEIFAGVGRAYGAEFLVKKTAGRATGWLSYTLSRTTRQIDGINDGRPYLARYDRTHDIALVASYEVSDRLLLSSNWVYATGNAVSFPIGRYTVDGQTITLWDDSNRNADRMPDYHRLDLSATLKPKPRTGRKWDYSWTFSIYNAYARRNAFTLTFEDILNEDINFDEGEDGPIETRRPGIIKTYLFSILPSVTFNFEF